MRRSDSRPFLLLFALSICTIAISSCSYKKAAQPQREALTFASQPSGASLMLSVPAMATRDGGGGESADAGSSRKIVRNASVEIEVGDVSSASAKIRALAESMGGYVEKLSQTGSGRQSATIIIRVPSARLDESVSQLKSLATRVEREEITTRDVTREYIDLDARLRNAQAEEQQYLQILKRAATVKDTLDVTEKLSEVRGSIEQLQGEMKYLTSQIDLSSIQVSVYSEAEAAAMGVHWRPLRRARLAWSEMLAGLADWADNVIEFLINLQVYILWVASFVFLGVLAWRIGRWLWRRLIPGEGWHWPWTRKSAGRTEN